MSRKRLTREETREQTTQRLLDAAAKVIARKGLDATSVEDIAEAAGYSRGAFYSNFSAKEDLFIELLRRDHARVTAELASLRSDDLPLDHIEARVTEFYGHMYRDNECFINWAEARLLAVRDARFRAKLNALQAEKRDLRPPGCGAAAADADHGAGLHEPGRRRQAVDAVKPRGHVVHRCDIGHDPLRPGDHAGREGPSGGGQARCFAHWLG
jgi:AcrR family transcriptional regulator